MDPETFEGTLAILRCLDIGASMQLVLAPRSWLWERATRAARSFHRGRGSVLFEDLFQEVLLRLSWSYHNIVAAIRRGTLNERTYLNACLRNACRTATSKCRPPSHVVLFNGLGVNSEGEEGYEASIPDHRELPMDDLDRDRRLVRLRAAVLRLDGRDRVIFQLLLDHDEDEVATITGLDHKEVLASRGRSIGRLRRFLRRNDSV